MKYFQFILLVNITTTRVPPSFTRTLILQERPSKKNKKNQMAYGNNFVKADPDPE